MATGGWWDCIPGRFVPSEDMGFYSFTPDPSLGESPFGSLTLPSFAPNTQNIKVRYTVEGLEPLEYIGEGISDWVDLRAAEDVFLEEGEFRLISLGVAIELPRGYEAIMAPRSSTYKNWGILEANSIGIIDEAYRGDNDVWRFAALATRLTHVRKNDRICQFRIIEHQPRIIFETVDKLDNPDRSGFGSTGHK